jgi:hypothetical protein
MKILVRARNAALWVFVVFWTLIFTDEVVHWWQWKRVASQVSAAYQEAASRGELPQPAASPGAITASSLCGLGLPTTVAVRTLSGETMVFEATRRKTSRGWNFELVFCKDAGGDERLY